MPLCLRSSAKYADAFRSISLAWRSSFTSRSSVLAPARLPESRAACASQPEQRLRRASDLAGNRNNRNPLRGVIACMLSYHPNRAFTHLRRVIWSLLLVCHKSTHSKKMASGKPGTVHHLLQGVAPTRSNPPAIAAEDTTHRSRGRQTPLTDRPQCDLYQ